MQVPLLGRRRSPKHLDYQRDALGDSALLMLCGLVHPEAVADAFPSPQQERH